MLLRTRTACLALLLAIPVLAAEPAVAQLYTFGSPNTTFNGFFGEAVAGVADTDGDGAGDVLVGARGDRHDEFSFLTPGRAYLFSGATGQLLHALTSPNARDGGLFGFSVAAVPDADGDGRDDLLVGAFREDANPVGQAGRAHLFSGATGALLHSLVSPNPAPQGFFGYSVAGVPDATGDGYGDLLVAANFEEGASGQAYLFDGLSGTLVHTLASPNPEAFGRFGDAVAGVPDVDGDGRGDLLVGARYEDGSEENGGRAYLFSGASGTLLFALESPSPAPSGLFGHAVAGTSDLDGDGGGELLIGAPFEEGAGRVYVFSGSTGALLHTFASSDSPSNFGYGVSGVPDADGDGRDEVLIGSSREADYAGRAYLFSGTTGALLRTLESPNPEPRNTSISELGGYFGEAVAGVPDATGDGRGDLLVGAPGEEPSGSPRTAGRAYLFSGRADATPPECARLAIEFNDEGLLAAVNTAVSDAGSGIAAIVVTSARNVEAFFDGTGPFVEGDTYTTPDPNPETVQIRAERLSFEVGGRFVVTVTDGAGNTALCDPVVSQLSATVPEAFTLEPAYPNPFRSQTALRFGLATAERVRLAVYDVLGREVAVLVDEVFAPGRYEVAWDGADASGQPLAAGVYLVRIEAGSFVGAERVTLVR